MLTPGRMQFKIELESHPAFAPEERDTLDNKLWVALAEAGLLVGPGWIFGSHDDMEPPTEGHLRISFSNAEVCVFSNDLV